MINPKRLAKSKIAYNAFNVSKALNALMSTLDKNNFLFLSILAVLDIRMLKIDPEVRVSLIE